MTQIILYSALKIVCIYGNTVNLFKIPREKKIYFFQHLNYQFLSQVLLMLRLLRKYQMMEDKMEIISLA